MRSKLASRIVVLFLLSASLSASALAWWAAGHGVIVRAAALALPQDVPEFFCRGAATIESYSSDPDVWSSVLPALKAAEGPEHYFNLELVGKRDLPGTRAEFAALCRGLELAPEKVGFLPYAIQEQYERLVLAFAEHRRWPDDEDVRAKVLYIAGILSHYAGDAAEPLDCTVHYDGRARADGSSPKTGIQEKMDADEGPNLIEQFVPQDTEIIQTLDFGRVIGGPE